MDPPLHNAPAHPDARRHQPELMRRSTSARQRRACRAPRAIVVTPRIAGGLGGGGEIAGSIQYRRTCRDAEWAIPALRRRVDDRVDGGVQSLALAEIQKHIHTAPPGGTAGRPG